MWVLLLVICASLLSIALYQGMASPDFLASAGVSESKLTNTEFMKAHKTACMKIAVVVFVLIFIGLFLLVTLVAAPERRFVLSAVIALGGTGFLALLGGIKLTDSFFDWIFDFIPQIFSRKATDTEKGPSEDLGQLIEALKKFEEDQIDEEPRFQPLTPEQKARIARQVAIADNYARENNLENYAAVPESEKNGVDAVLEKVDRDGRGTGSAPDLTSKNRAYPDRLMNPAPSHPTPPDILVEHDKGEKECWVGTSDMQRGLRFWDHLYDEIARYIIHLTSDFPDADLKFRCSSEYEKEIRFYVNREPNT